MVNDMGVPSIQVNAICLRERNVVCTFEVELVFHLHFELEEGAAQQHCVQLAVELCRIDE